MSATPRRATKQPRHSKDEFYWGLDIEDEPAPSLRASSSGLKPVRSCEEAKDDLKMDILTAGGEWDPAWEVTRSIRRSGKSQGGADYYYHLRGVKLRSRFEALKHLGLAAPQINPTSQEWDTSVALEDPASLQSNGRRKRKCKRARSAAANDSSPNLSHVAVRGESTFSPGLGSAEQPEPDEQSLCTKLSSRCWRCGETVHITKASSQKAPYGWQSQVRDAIAYGPWP
ncbi:hypothetical protein WJX84_002073 [Apatococcus fuscideae]|uniref:MBD domain-containing protein n=1 Tax=Apatococcus fuscideae TaxID=2026836 RepID=A0AAW1T9R2_9CHLO